MSSCTKFIHYADIFCQSVMKASAAPNYHPLLTHKITDLTSTGSVGSISTFMLHVGRLNPLNTDHLCIKTSCRVLIGYSAQKLKADFQSLDHPDFKMAYYVYVEQVWPELEGPQTERFCLLLV